MQVENKFVIDGKPVEFEVEFAGVKVYKRGDDSETTLYFTLNGRVVQKLYVEADCGQNTGYISALDFSGVK